MAAASLYAQGVIEKKDTLDTSYVTAVKEKMRNTTQTGLMRLDGNKLRSTVAAFGTPDLIKSLQMLPGVAAGNELMSGLYVHGGDGNDNLFLLDGVPLYNIAHFGGFFSSFNTDVVENLDFYKSGFPARYGGRLSSVVDVETSEGDMHEYHGNFSLGLIDGRIQVEGPIWKDHTSFNFGLRRSWLDIITVPALLYVNHENKNNPKSSGGYAMWDLNARVTHKLGKDSKLNANFYWGDDNLHAGIKESMTESFMDIGVRSTWGSLTSSLSWEAKYGPKTNGKLLAYYTRSGSDIGYTFDVGSIKDGAEKSILYFSDDNRCSVNDAGLKYDLDWYPNSSHHVRTGATVAWHHYATGRDYVQKGTLFELADGGNTENKTDSAKPLGEEYHAWEPAIYFEDEIFLAYNFTLNAGLRLSLFGTKLKTWPSIEPRAALKWLITNDVCAKLSYTRMSQYIHLVSAMYIDLPTNSWMPSTPEAGPMVSDQIAGGIYLTPGNFKINLEGWYKTMDGMLAYNGANAFYPPLVNWEKSFTSGSGKSYGMEFETTYSIPKLELSAYYTLSWSWRQFDAYYMFPYPDRNDNRHKINLVGNWNFAKGWYVSFNWNWHSGNRITLPSHVIMGDEGYVTDMVYESPFNAKLPDYHRLDISADYKWDIDDEGRRFLCVNLSIYNVYNHMNASFAMLDQDEKGNYRGMAYGLIPIIPTLSVSFKF